MSPAALRPWSVLLLAALAQCGDGEGIKAPAAAPTQGTAAQAGAGQGAAGQGVAGQAEAAPAPALLGEKIHVVVSGAMDGKLEPCGCASGQLGGLPRRMTYLEEIHGADLLLEGGNLVGGASALDLEKAFTAVEVLFSMPMRYDALGLGPRDLELPLDLLGDYLSAYDAPVVASDLEPLETRLAPRAFVEKTVRGQQVRVVSLCMNLPQSVLAMEKGPLRLLPPAEGYARGLAGADPTALIVLMVHEEPEVVRQLAASLQPRPDLIVAMSESVHEPPTRPALVGDTPIVYPGVRGRFLVDLRLSRSQNGAVVPQYDAVPLRASETKPSAGQHPAVREILRRHRIFVAEEGLREKMAGLREPPSGNAYVGSSRCGECHQEDLLLWRNSKHGRAWDTLVRAEQDPDRYGWPVTQYPDCVSCHVVGYGERTGFVSPTATPDLHDVGCERCHGPGNAHSQNPKGSPMGKVGGGTPSVVCTQCHDFEQSPDFDYSKRWPLIQHGTARPKAR